MIDIDDNDPIKIMLVDDHFERAASVEEKLSAAGFIVLCRLPTTAGLLHQIEQHQPDMVLIDLQSPGRDVLESLSVLNNHNPKPVVMFTEKDDPAYIEAAVDAGVTAYLMDELNPKRVKPIIDLAIAQFKSYQSLRQALDEAQRKLASQSIIEKAKTLLIKKHNIDENKAHKTLRTLSMDTNQSLPDAAKSVIDLMEKTVV
jgi:response regulator NasT